MKTTDEPPFIEERLIFPPHPLHNHASCVTELPDGSMLACWYRGSGERQADDVAVYGARLPKGAADWSEPFVMADTPGFPDANPCMIVDRHARLWLFWPTILDNHWESALLKARVSRDYMRGPGAPAWESDRVIHLKPGTEFAAAIERDLEVQWEPYLQTAGPEEREKRRAYLDARHAMAQNKLSARLGWMPRARPILLGNRLILPLYSDGFDFSMMAFTDDDGATWQVSEPLVGPGNVQPSLARRSDGTLVAYFRDNGPPPQRVMQSESSDDGRTWTRARDIEVPDPGAGLEVCALRSGRWVLINNDTEAGRHRLALHVSEDEGRTWPRRRYVERDEPGPDAGSYAYPSLLQASDGSLHATYTYRPNAARAPREGTGETIKHVRFNEAWLLTV